ncbi:hypothetical protein CAOG_08763 [Capsaspora owczarzaki ATCC 30864]|nr:hypothetical protein CAOG_08763 [Capsaspora owczarzaki ATCC 30864]|eukprot:XP_011270393.1 hypothetical protein CAOG_08763 [Capsaspora owczarzaki ATCC 30864]
MHSKTHRSMLLDVVHFLTHGCHELVSGAPELDGQGHVRCADCWRNRPHTSCCFEGMREDVSFGVVLCFCFSVVRDLVVIACLLSPHTCRIRNTLFTPKQPAQARECSHTFGHEKMRPFLRCYSCYCCEYAHSMDQDLE